MDKTGFSSVGEAEAEQVIAEHERDGWRVFRLPASMSSKNDFFAGVRRALPLDPPLSSNQSWDALADSLWAGLDGCSERKILIVWRGSCAMEAKVPEEFAIAMDILGELAESLADAEITAGPTKDVLVLRVVDPATPGDMR